MANPKLKYLEDVPWDNSLKLSNGKTVHGLEQLPMVIKFSDDEVFSSHVTDQKNDFANWIRDVIGDTELAEKLLPIKNKDEFLKFMEQAITDIKHYVAPEPVSTPTPVPTPVSVSTPTAPVVSPVVQPAEQLTPTSVIAPVVPPVQQSVSTPAVQSIVSPVIAPVVPLVVQPTVTPATLSVTTPPVQPVVQPAPIVETPVPIVAPVAPTVAPVTISVVAPAPTIPNPAPVTNTVSVPETSTSVEETFDFEDIFKVLIGELEQEVLAWDVQTS